ncbi:unnamed protein product [Linum tenue]|uniref:Uncharacterized protein n=1 Tax=Linum tenue TaxID=586396 RepID=A0AAV0MGA8_9ROSI|nr:unnamed protein product [Linum tenue]
MLFTEKMNNNDAGGMARMPMAMASLHSCPKKKMKNWRRSTEGRCVKDQRGEGRRKAFKFVSGPGEQQKVLSDLPDGGRKAANGIAGRDVSFRVCMIRNKSIWVK